VESVPTSLSLVLVALVPEEQVGTSVLEIGSPSAMNVVIVELKSSKKGNYNQ
jgi:hypothetical protein